MDEIRCPKCEYVSPVSSSCPVCEYPMLKKLRTLIVYHRIMNVILWIICITFMCSALFAILLLFNGKEAFITSGIIAVVSLILMIVAKQIQKLIGYDINEYNPDQSINIFAFLARIVAIGVGFELMHLGADAISAAIDPLNAAAATHIPSSDITPVHSSVAEIGLHRLEHQGEVAGPELSSFHRAHETLGTHIDSADVQINPQDNDHAYAIHDAAGSIDSYVDLTNNGINVRDHVGIIKQHVDVGNYSDIMRNSHGEMTGIINHSVYNDTIKNQLGVTSFTIEDNGHIYDSTGMLIGSIEKSGKSLFIRDKTGFILNSLHM